MIKGLRFNSVIEQREDMSPKLREEACAKYLVGKLRGSFTDRLISLMDTDMDRIIRDPVGHLEELFDSTSIRYYLTGEEISKILIDNGLCSKKSAVKIVPELLQTPITIGYLEYSMQELKIGKDSFYGLGAKNIAYRNVEEDLLPRPSKRLERSL